MSSQTRFSRYTFQKTPPAVLKDFTLASELAPIGSSDWSDQEPYTSIDDITQLNVDATRKRYVRQGTFAELDSIDRPKVVMSEGFSKCSALILRSSIDDRYVFAHVQPFDDMYYELEPIVDNYDQAFLAYGTHSVWQRDIELHLVNSGISLHYAQTQTDRGHFGVALHTSTNQISVVRKQPDQTIFSYDPFTSAS